MIHPFVFELSVSHATPGASRSGTFQVKALVSCAEELTQTPHPELGTGHEIST